MNKASFAAKSKVIVAQIWKAIKHIFFHNGWVKLLAMLISLVLWAGLISQDDSLTREKTWQNVNVSITGSDTMKRNHYIVVSDLESLLSNVAVTAAVPQKRYDSADLSAYNVRVDLSRINGTGTQELKIISTASTTYGKIVSTTPSVVSVEVEEYLTRNRIPVSATVIGDYTNGWYKDWYISSLSTDPALITVSGPRTVALTISKGKAFIDLDTLDWTEGTLLTTGKIKLYNQSDKEVSSSLLEITTENTPIDTVLIERKVLPTKTFNVRDLVTFQGHVKSGYTATIKCNPETITVAARNEVLDQLDEPVLDKRVISIQDLSETQKFEIKVSKPSDDAVLKNDTVIVTVEVEKKE